MLQGEMMCDLSRAFVVVVVLGFCCLDCLAQDNDWLEAKLIKSQVQIKKKQKIAMLSHHPKQYKILLEVRPDKSGAQWGNILQFTPGGIKATPFGNHIATVFYHGTGQQLMVTSSISGIRDFHSYQVIAPGRWHTVEIIQEKLGGDYYYSVKVNGQELNSAINNKTEMSTNVTVFAGAPWYETVPGSIRKLSFFYKARCVDTGKNCKEYAAGDYCTRYKQYMQKNCKVTCGFCDKPAPAGLKQRIAAKGINCNRNNGGCNHICKRNKCQCRKGYKLGSNKMTCSDIDECAASSTTCEHICKNTRGSYRCTCVEGFTLVNNKCTYACPPLVPVPGCAGDPCRTTTCPRNSNAICKTNFCGGCNARFYTKSGKKVECSVKRKPCKDSRFCKGLKRKGFCTRYKDFMSEKCRKACGYCTGAPVVPPKRVTPVSRPGPRRRPVNGNWGRWTAYGRCSRTCGRGTKTRTRVCNNPAPTRGGRSCPGSASEARSCNTRSCPVVAPQKKTPGSACTKYDHKGCDGYIRQKSYYCSRGWVKRNCPQMCGRCTRQGKKTAPKKVAPVSGKAACGVDNSHCTSYEQIKSYACTQQWLKENCKQMCHLCKQTVAVPKRVAPVRSRTGHSYAVNGNWGRWSAYDRCSRTCGGGTHARRRACDNPAPSNGGASCAGRNTETRSCGSASCRVVPVSSHQGPACTKPDDRACKRYERSKTWYCTRGWVKNNCARMCGHCTPGGSQVAVPKRVVPTPGRVVPRPRQGQVSGCTDHSVCKSYENMISYACTQRWMKNNCKNMCSLCKQTVAVPRRKTQVTAHPVNGNWGRWSAYGRCSRTCGDGTKTRTRVCTNPAPTRGGRSCSGSPSEARSCNTRSCPAVARKRPAPVTSHQGKECTRSDSGRCNQYERSKSYYCNRDVWVKRNCAQMCQLCTPRRRTVAAVPKKLTPAARSGKRSCAKPDHNSCSQYQSYKQSYCTQPWLRTNCADMCELCVWRKKK